MGSRGRGRSKGRAHRFGGDWTQAKLDVLAEYLKSYTTALKDRPFLKAYIDAFAGTGYRSLKRDPSDALPGELLFPDTDHAAQQLLDGSARRALQTEPRFDRYVFIERSPDRCAQLELLKQDFPDRAEDIRIEQGDANERIQALCAKDWSKRRAVLFLDPYGMQVEWKTLRAVADTRAIDLWLLFPLGIGVNRLLTRSGEIPRLWRTRLDLLLGTADWYDELYRVESQRTLFGAEERVVKATQESIGKYFNRRLREVFADVADPPGVLRNSANCPLYLFCFAASNEKGAPIAVRIANHLLKDLR
jgi:three-Cys-motif partner protein